MLTYDETYKAIDKQISELLEARDAFKHIGQMCETPGIPNATRVSLTAAVIERVKQAQARIAGIDFTSVITESERVAALPAAIAPEEPEHSHGVQ